MVQMAQIFSANLPAISLDFVPTAVVFSSALKGPQAYVSGGSFSATIQSWEMS